MLSQSSDKKNTDKLFKQDDIVKPSKPIPKEIEMENSGEKNRLPIGLVK
jgi:hypothetical protein